MKKIGVFVDRWMSGGIESYLVSNFEHMNLEDLDISIITTRKFSNLYDDRLEMLDIQIKELLPKEKDSELTRTYRSLRAFRKELTSGYYDVLHLNIYNGVSLVYSKIAKECGVEKVIAHSHNSAIGQVRLRAIKILFHRLGKLRYEKFVSDYWACSDLAGNWLFSSKRAEQVVLMANGIDTAKFTFNAEKRKYFREHYQLSDDELVLGSVGRLNNQKNQMHLIETAYKLNKRGVAFKLLIAGEGELKTDLQKKIIENRLENAVHLIGTITDTPSFYSAIDIFLLPSLFEGNPIVGIEAQSSGVKCLFSDRITKQAKTMESTEFLSLQSEEEWVRSIEAYHQVPISRQLISYEEKKNPFDIVDTSAYLQMNLLN